MRKLLVILLAASPAGVWAAESEPEPGPASWNMDQLCEQRHEPRALTEIERRNVFSRDELRAIERDRVRKGISRAALNCFMGSPDDVVPMPWIVHARDGLIEFEAYVYDVAGENRLLVVHIKYSQGEAIVADYYKSARAPEFGVTEYQLECAPAFRHCSFDLRRERITDPYYPYRDAF